MSLRRNIVRGLLASCVVAATAAPAVAQQQQKPTAATVPAGFTNDGLPIGLQIVGRHLDDATVLRAAAAYEPAAPWKDKWPPMLAQMGL
jgi:Asp-tRNA(Asn)/Glu-tRNA(Gln) amidotransferase A subunit family amidase